MGVTFGLGGEQSLRGRGKGRWQRTMADPWLRGNKGVGRLTLTSLPWLLQVSRQRSDSPILLLCRWRPRLWAEAIACHGLTGGPGWVPQTDSCSGLWFPVEPVPGPATSPVVTRHGLLGQGAGLWSQRLSNSLPQGAMGKFNQLLKNKNKLAADQL